MKEIGANKLSALLWRTQIRNRKHPIGSITNDQVIIRHLYDLSAMKQYIKNNNFIMAFKNSFLSDSKRFGQDMDCTIQDMLNNLINRLKNDKLYKEEYINFVYSMCYEDNNGINNFDNNLDNLIDIVGFILKFVI